MSATCARPAVSLQLVSYEDGLVTAIEVIRCLVPGVDEQLAANCKLLYISAGILGKRAGWAQDPR